jgi:uncharacterized Fe-S radical SAM superfamily protein PflX
MGQYRPEYQVGSTSRSGNRQYVDIERRPTSDELRAAKKAAAAAGLTRLDARW